jgi:hypothetical protein
VEFSKLSKLIVCGIQYLTTFVIAANSMLGKPTIVNKFTLVIQEYFQERVKAWLETVGKKLLGIKHHWLRYEFAPSRGQIHAHMLVICDNKEVMKQCQARKHDKQQLARYLSSWLADTLGMTANVEPKYAKIKRNQETHPSTVRYSSLVDQDLDKDLVLCQLSFQKHKCSKYCMRDSPKVKKGQKSKEKQNRWCRCGAGHENTYGKCDTPGFPLRKKPAIIRDPRGFDRVDMPRNNPWIVQASSFLCQGWRGNCDIQYLLYKSDSDDLDVSDITRVTNYVVSYSCKGNETEIQEKSALKAIVLAAETEHGDNRDLRKLARRLLNEASKTRVISKQEATCQLAGLDLYNCSEHIKLESLAGEQRLGTDKEAQTSLLVKYARREGKLHGMNMYEFFEHTYNKSSNWHSKKEKKKIPMFTGARCEPVYPVTEGYARGVLLIYYPWNGRFMFDTKTSGFVDIFKNWIKDKARCPQVVRMGYERAKRLKHSTEPTSATADIEYDAMAVQPDKETRELVDLVSTIFTNDSLSSEPGCQLDFGRDHDWSEASVMVRAEIKLAQNANLNCCLTLHFLLDRLE